MKIFTSFFAFSAAKTSLAVTAILESVHTVLT